MGRLPHYRLFPNSYLKKGLRNADVFMLRTTVDQREVQCRRERVEVVGAGGRGRHGGMEGGGRGCVHVCLCLSL